METKSNIDAYRRMSKDDFIKIAWQGGYAKKKDAKKYTEANPKEFYSDEDLITLHERGMHWDEASTVRGLRGFYNRDGSGGKTTAFSNGIRYDNSEYQDFDTSK